MKGIRLALALMSLVLFCTDAQGARFRSSRSCGVGSCGSSCDTSSCNVGNSCGVAKTDVNLSTAQSVGIRNPAPKRSIEIEVDEPARVATGAKGDKGDKGDPGPAGPPGASAEVTEAQMNEIVQRVVGDLLVQMKDDPRFRGKDGVDGIAGKDGKDAVINVSDIAKEVQKQLPGLDYDDITAKVAVRLPPIKIEMLGAGGRAVPEFTQTVKLGGTVKIPPIVLQSRNPDGTVASGTKALGELVDISLVPVK